MKKNVFCMSTPARTKEGFTLIELLVVIAVIGILAAVILTALNQARDRGKVSTVQQELASLRSQAEVFYGMNGGTYTSFCSDSKVSAAVTDAKNQFVPGDSIYGINSGQTNRQVTNNPSRRSICRSTAKNWVVSIPTIAPDSDGDVTNFWCVDSNGMSRQQGTVIPAVPTSPTDATGYICT